MPRFIIHKDGVFNFYTTVGDGACYEGGLTEDQMREITKQEMGELGLKHLPGRLERARKTGCSATGWTLDEVIATTRQGPKESNMPRDEFIERYLTLPQRRGTEP